jgi:hypothetical protein
LELLITQSGSTLTASADGITLSGTLSGRSATLSGILPDGTTVTITFQFSNDGESFAGTVTYGSEVVTITGTRGRCFDYEFPSGEPQCVLPVANTDLVVGGQQFNSEYAGVVHTGLDFTFASPLPAIVAPCDGVVVEINQHPIALDNIITDVVIKYNDDWSTFIAFEPYSPDPTIAEAQASQIAVTVGQVVHRGDLLGHLFVPDPITAFPHIHWQVQRDGEAQIPECPRNFLMPDEQEALDVLYGSFGLLPVCLPSP